MKYAYRTQALTRSVHMLGPSNEAICQPGIRIFGSSKYTVCDEVPTSRQMCANCMKATMVGPQLSKVKKKRIINSKKRISLDFYRSWEWKKLRFEVLKAYGAICMLCRSTEHIVVDHIKPRARYPELQLVFENMQVLCDDCNRGKAGNDESDFRPKCPEPELTGAEAEHMRSILN